jgi:hypothetical protein
VQWRQGGIAIENSAEKKLAENNTMQDLGKYKTIL